MAFQPLFRAMEEVVSLDTPEKEEEKLEGSKYHYWHDKVPQGEGAAPPPEHKPIAVETTTAPKELPTVSIDNFGLMVRARARLGTGYDPDANLPLHTG